MFSKKYDEIPGTTAQNPATTSDPSLIDSFFSLFKSKDAAPTTTSSLTAPSQLKTEPGKPPITPKSTGYGACN